MPNNFLSLVIWVPILAGVIVLATGSDRNAALARWLALAGALLGLIVAIPLATGFDTTTSAMQFVEKAAWIPAFNVHYHLGVDGISMPLILLNSFVTVLVVIAGWQVIQDKVAQYMAAFLIMSGLINGVFAALDGILFYVFFEGMLIPLYLIVGVWGGPNRVYAAFKFFLYTLLGSLLMLVSMIYLYFQSGGSFDIQTWHTTALGMTAQSLMFFAFLLAFGVKVPMWPVHTWLPDAHVEAPTGGSVVLAAITLKVGAYGFLRFILPILPDASHEFAGFVILLSLIAVAYIGLVALVQADMKKLIAYSSIAHMGFVTPAFSPDQGLRRPGEQDAGIRRLLHAVRHGECRIAGHQRLRRGIHGHHGRDQGQFLVRFRRRYHANLGRSLHAVDVQARGVRNGHQSACRGNARHQRAGDPAARRARCLRAGHGPVSQAIHRRDARIGG